MQIDPQTLDRISGVVGRILTQNRRLFANTGRTMEDLKHDILAGNIGNGRVWKRAGGRNGQADGKTRSIRGVLRALEAFDPTTTYGTGTPEERSMRKLESFVARVAYNYMLDLHRSLTKNHEKEREYLQERAREQDKALFGSAETVQNSQEDSQNTEGFHPPLVLLAQHAMTMTSHILPLLTHRNAPGPFTVSQMVSSLIVMWEANWTPLRFVRGASHDLPLRMALRMRWRLPAVRTIYAFQAKNPKMPQLVQALHARALRELVAERSCTLG